MERWRKDSRREYLRSKATEYEQYEEKLKQKANESSSDTSSQSLRHGVMGNPDVIWDEPGLPVYRDEIEAILHEDDFTPAFESACRHDSLLTVQSMVESQKPPRTRFFLHHGLVAALRAGRTDIARYLLSAGAPIIRSTPEDILFAPEDQRHSLFELLIGHGWDVNTPSYYGVVLLPSVVASTPTLKLFLAHGAKPNLGRQLYHEDRFGGSLENACDALEAAAARGSLEAVRMLLDAGAKVENGYPLHSAAGSMEPGENPHYRGPMPSKTFDEGRIPIMALLLERSGKGAHFINQAEESLYVTFKYAIVYAVLARAVERVKWLMDHGADPYLKGGSGTAISAANFVSQEMRDIIDEHVKAKPSEPSKI